MQIGHRFSVNIDLFGNAPIDEIEFVEELSNFGAVIILKKSKNIIIFSVGGIKVDFVNYKYALLDKLTSIDGFRVVQVKKILQ